MTFAWTTPLVNGIPPEERYAHTACFVELPDSEGGNRMVVMGGVGAQVCFGDVHLLRTSNPSVLSWELPEVTGMGPGVTYGFSAQTVGHGVGARHIVTACGVHLDNTASDAVFVLTVRGLVGPDGITSMCQWTRVVNRIPDVFPPSRSRAGFASTPSGLYLFGGNLLTHTQSERELKDRMLHHLHLSPDLTMASWSVPPVFVCDAGIEPQIIIRPSCVHDDLNVMLSQQLFADVILQVSYDTDLGCFLTAAGTAGGPRVLEAEFRAHRWLLVSRSPHLRAMLGERARLREATSTVVRVVGTPPLVFRALLEFLYTGGVDIGAMVPEMAVDILRAAGMYQLPDLAALAQGRLIRFVDDENAAELCTLAHALNAPLLASAAKAVIFRHFAKISTSDVFRAMPDDLRSRLEREWCSDTHAFRFDAPHPEPAPEPSSTISGS